MSPIAMTKVCLLGLLYFNSFALVSPQEIEPLAEMYNYCAYINAYTGNYTIQDSYISWGKWTKGPGTSEEIASPKYKTIQQGKSLQVCSSGRAWTPSGTQAYIVLSENTRRDPIVIGWNVPFVIGDFEHYFHYNSTFYAVYRYEMSTDQPTSHLYQYNLYKK